MSEEKVLEYTCWDCVYLKECPCCECLLCMQGIKLPEVDSSPCDYFVLE